MVATKTNLLFLILTLCFLNKSNAQECGNCKSMPSLAAYDFDIQIAQPEKDPEAIKKWTQLFWLARHANNHLAEQNKSCIKITQPVYQTDTKKTFLKDGIELPPLVEEKETMKIGITTANVPADGDLSRFGNYISTGSIKKNGGGYVVHMEIQVACNRKVVAFSDVSFQLSSDSKYIEEIAHLAAAKLTPLIDKIKVFESNERKERTQYAFGGNGRDRIRIIPAKNKMMPGETTDITVVLKDCDGVALGGRTINFTGLKGENEAPATIGGIVTPAQIITDGNGQAKAKFKLTALKNQPGIINAYTLSETSSMCSNAFLGSIKIDAMEAYKIEINYTKKGSDGNSMHSNEDGVEFKAGSGRFWKVEHFIDAFYYPPSSQKREEQIMIMPDYAEEKIEIEPLTEGVEIEPLTKSIQIMSAEGSQMGKSFFYFSGRSELHGWGKNLSLLGSPVGMKIDHDVEYETIRSETPLAPAISMQFKNNELIFFSCALDFPVDAEDKQPTGGSFGIEINNKTYFPLKPVKITDPNSPYKSVYIIEYKTSDNFAPSGKVMKFDKYESEIATVKIYSPF